MSVTEDIYSLFKDTMGKKIVVIGAGFAGLAAATSLAKEGYEVTLLEKNAQTGGRARKFKAEGFTFDMGPSWYWMPDVFDQYFAQFNKKTADYYDLTRLDPSYKVCFGKEDDWLIPAKLEELFALFESKEKGSAAKLHTFLEEAAYKYEVGIQDLVYRPCRSVWEFADFRLLKGLVSLHIFQSFGSYVRKYFKHPQLIQLLEFPILFLGAVPQNTPALYSLMNYADINLGTWYPMGGMHKIVEGMTKLAKEMGVKIHLNSPVERIEVAKGKAKAVWTTNDRIEADIIIGAGDYHHIEQELLPIESRQYTEEYWDKRTMAPSSLLFYLGVNKRLKKLEHHNLFFDTDFALHADEIYTHPQWPTNPLFYACCPSKTDPTTAPEGHENLFLLVPVAPNLEDTPEMREHYYQLVMNRLEALTGQNIAQHIVYKRSYAHKDFKADYHAYKGNAYGLANTLMQTAILKPALKSKKVSNLYYTGQLTVPGPGVPPSLISGQVVAKEIQKDFPLIQNMKQARISRSSVAATY